MTYKEYIDLGFERIEISDNVVFNEVGYNGYILSQKINNIMFIEICYPDLDKPIIFIRKIGSDFCHRISVTPEMIKDIFTNV